MSTFKSKAENTKNLIASKAKEVFCQKGYFQASMEDIRINSGASKGSIYYHFKSKEELFIYILELYVDEWISKWKEKSSGSNTAKDKLYALAEHFALDYESPLMKAAAEFAGSESADPKIKEKLNELNVRYIPLIQAIISEGVEAKEFKFANVEELTIVTLGFLAGIGAICQIVNHSDIPKIHKLSVDVFLNGLNK